MVRNGSHQVRGSPHRQEVPGAVQGMKSRPGHLRAVADVMQPRRIDEQPAVLVRHRRSHRPRTGSDFAGVVPAVTQAGQQAPGQLRRFAGAAGRRATSVRVHVTERYAGLEPT